MQLKYTEASLHSLEMNLTFFSLAFLSVLVIRVSAAPVDFAREILPVLSNKCFVCHGPDAKKKDLIRLDSYEGATRELDGYKVIDPKNPAESEMIVRLQDAEDPMPPQDAEKQLTLPERKLIIQWVKEGGQYAKHWAFVPPKKKKISTKGNPVDAFIGARLKASGVTFAAEADKATLARRVALVLTGLPPEPKQLKAFLNDKSSQAYEKLVNELLASPRYGEHQARYWLDAVRYGDTHGLHLDNKRGIFPYRDWVVRALNLNQPLDEFLTWQLAGDLLPNPTTAQLVATGFVRMNPTTAEGGAIPEEFQAKNNFDRVETLGTALLGMSLNCARCHTHKYDPISQKEYYQMLAFFNSTAEPSMDGNRYEFGPTIKAPADASAWANWDAIQTEEKAVRADQARILERARAFSEKPENKDLLAKMSKKNNTPQDRLKLVADPKGGFKELAIHKESGTLLKRMDALKGRMTTTLVAKDLPKPRVTKFLERGEYDQPRGEPLEPGVFAAMSAFPKEAPRNRLGLAQWLTAREHPLVSRVMINQLWQRTFGEALVRTPADFGLQGEQPSHPELLDWLAVELQDQKWNLKTMLRLMVTSRTFKQSSAYRQAIKDPENRLFSRGPSFRMDAETLRDVALWASGLLNESMGGEGVKPYQPVGLWKALMHPGSNTKNYVPDKDARQYQRSLYVYWKRTSPHPMMTLFDAPSRESSCVQRSRTSTPTQSLALLNEKQRVEMGRNFGERLMKGAAADNAFARIRLLFELVAGRAPTETEEALCLALYMKIKYRYKNNEADAKALLAIGDSPRDEKLDVIEHAAWTQVAITVLASEIALWIY